MEQDPVGMELWLLLTTMCLLGIEPSSLAKATHALTVSHLPSPFLLGLTF